MSVDKVRGYNFYPWAVCITAGCSWDLGASDRTRWMAKEHAKVKGHHVQVVQENHDHYAPSGYEFSQDKSDDELKNLGGYGVRSR